MATFEVNAQLTMLETMKRLGPDGKLLNIAEVLNEENAVIKDAVFMKANNKFTHVTLQRNSLPTGSVRDFNKGVASEQGNTERQSDVIQMLRSYLKVDKELADASGDPNTYRNDEARGFIEGFGQTFAGDMFYSNNSTFAQEQMTGFARRLNTVDSKRVFNTGGSGSDVTSIFIIQWGINKVYCPYTEGASAGMDVRSLGEDTSTDSNGLEHQIYRDYFKWDYGLTIEDPQCVARIANIETSGSSNIFNKDLIHKALPKMRGGGKRAVLYVNDTVFAQMTIDASDRGNVNLFWSSAFGDNEDTLTFMGRPIRLVDQLVSTETAIS
jgi:hypothetical protein